MKENLGFNSSEDDSSEDGEENKKTKKSTKIPRRLPFGLKLDQENDTTVEKPRLSIGERLLQQMELKAVKTKEAEKLQGDTDKKTDSTDVIEAPVEVDAPIDDAWAESSDSEHAELHVDEETVATEPIADVLNVSWDNEGELTDDSEIDLSGNSPSEATGDPAETSEEFVVLPVETSTHEDEEPVPVDPELLDSGLGDSEPPEPSEDAPEYTEPAEPERHVATTGAVAAERTWYDAAEADVVRRAHETELNDAEYYAEKRGKSQGVAAGLFAGWLFGRRGKKKAQKEHVKELKTKNKEINDLKSEQFTAQERIKTIQRNQEQLQSNIQAESARASQESAKKNTEAAMVEKSAASNPSIERSSVGESNAFLVETAATAAIAGNKSRSTEKAKSAETQPENKEITEDTYHSSEGSRVETSAWHRIEIDEKTGKPIESPDVAYGEEFRRERRQEILPKDRTGGTSGGSANLIGGVATAALASIAGVSTVGQASALSAVPATPGDKSKALDVAQLAVHPHLSAGNEVLHYASKPLTWAIAVIVVLLLFVVGILR